MMRHKVLWAVLFCISILFIVLGIVNGGLLHYVVIHKVSKNKIIIADPGSGIVKYTPEEFFKIWSGVLIILVPTARFQKGNENQFVITRKEEELIAMPVTVLVLIMLCSWPFSAILMFVGLFLGARYSFRGPNASQKVNDAMNKAANAVQGDPGSKVE